MKAVMRMKVDFKEKNPALVSLFENPGQTIFLDANFLIPPDRTKVGAKPREKLLNPEWGDFIREMNLLYPE